MNTYSMISLEPVPSQDGEIPRRSRKRHRNLRTAQDSDATKPASSFVECKGREVVEAANLVFHLKKIGHVLSWRNRTVGPWHSILP